MRLSLFLDNEKKRLGRVPRVGFFGLGVSNLALIREMSCIPYTVRCDSDLPRSFKLSEHNGVTAYVGAMARQNIDEDILFLSPSVRRDAPELLSAVSRGTVLLSDAELFFLDSPEGGYGITGSDGKSTTATITAALLRAPLIGNIGVPFAEAPVSGDFVAELSSFQLSYLKPRLRGALLTSLSPNHLDWHTSFREYISAKLGIFENAERAVLSPDTEGARDFLVRSGIKPFALYSTELSYGELRSYPAEHYLSLLGGRALLDGEELLDLSHTPLREWYNIHNFMGAVALTLGRVSRERVGEVARDFKPLPSRGRIVHSRFGIDFIDASIDTTPTRTAATLRALARPVSLILGGRSKGAPLAPLLPLIGEYAVSVAVYGECREKYFREVCGVCPVCEAFSDFRSAVEFSVRFQEKIAEKTAAGASESTRGAVLLSPAATSYGEFHDYRERAEKFYKIVKNLPPRGV